MELENCNSHGDHGNVGPNMCPNENDPSGTKKWYRQASQRLVINPLRTVHSIQWTLKIERCSLIEIYRTEQLQISFTRTLYKNCLIIDRSCLSLYIIINRTTRYNFIQQFRCKRKEIDLTNDYLVISRRAFLA